MLYLIEILHQTTTGSNATLVKHELYLIEILHQTTTFTGELFPTISCILSKFYIKPQHQRRRHNHQLVVSYRNSTSNHNNRSSHNIGQLVVSYRNSTSNHNNFRCSSTSILVVSYRNSTSNHNTRNVIS